jgi:hypothetical protein
MAEVRFEDQRGCHLVDNFAAGLTVFYCEPMVGAVEDGVGVGCSVAFVEELEGGWGFEMLSEMRAEGGGKGFGFGGLEAGLAGGVDGEADENRRHVVTADEASDGFEVGLQRGAVDCEQRLGGVTERVGQGDADAAVADVEGENALERHLASVRRAIECD